MSSNTIRHSQQLKYGIVGGLGGIAGADTLLKMIKATPQHPGPYQFNIAFEQHQFQDDKATTDSDYSPISRKFYVYNTLKDMEGRGIQVALVPCFISQTFLDEVTPQLRLSVVSMLEALKSALERDYPAARNIGILTSNYVRNTGFFDNFFNDRWNIIYPDPKIQSDKLMKAIYGSGGIREGHDETSVDMIVETCDNLIQNGADIIIPGLTEVPVIVNLLRERVQVPIMDSNQVYAEFALSVEGALPPREFKIGIVGGVGPAATADFMEKIVRLTEANKDQDHIKIVVEHNPQIPDRTANLIGNGDDPTIPLLATCRKLEAAGANIIAIPCNTAHAFVERIQPHLSVKIVNMLDAVSNHIETCYPKVKKVGLLATSGTVASGVYRGILEEAGFLIVLPEPPMQVRLMQAIYGESGVKAGFTEGACSTHLEAAITHLVQKGADIVILGCTELPLIQLSPAIRGASILLDPTEILASLCITHARYQKAS